MLSRCVEKKAAEADWQTRPINVLNFLEGHDVMMLFCNILDNRWIPKKRPIYLIRVFITATIIIFIVNFLHLIIALLMILSINVIFHCFKIASEIT